MQKKKQTKDREFLLLTRFHNPTKFDKAPYGTIYTALVGETDINHYIQVGTDIDNPDWRPMGEVLIAAFEDLFTDDDFIALCLALLNKREIKDLENKTKSVN